MAGLEGWLQQLAAATSAGIDTPGDQLSAAATLFRIWLPGDPAALAAPKALFEAIDAAGADVDWSAAAAAAGLLPPFSELAAYTCAAVAAASAAVRQLHGGRRQLRSPSHSYEQAYAAAKKAMGAFVESEYISKFSEAEDGQLQGIASLLYAFSVNARRLAIKADAERAAIHGFVNSADSKVTDVADLLRTNYGNMMQCERSAADRGGGRGGAAAQSVLVTVVQLLKVFASQNHWGEQQFTATVDWARGRRLKRSAQDAGMQQATNNAYQKVGRHDFWYGKPNRHCMAPGWTVEPSADPVYLQQYRPPAGPLGAAAVPSFALPMDGCAHFGKAQLVAYLFLLGKRVLIYDGNNDGIPRYLEAQQLLATAFARCHRGAASQKRLILQYLAPASMLCGRLPSAALLQKYGLPALYHDVLAAIRGGDLPRYERAMADGANTDWLMGRGLWMVMQALRVVVQARFFRHVHKLNGGGATLSLPFIQRLLYSLSPAPAAAGGASAELERTRTPRTGGGGPGMTDAVEQMATRMIDMGYVKGFLRTADKTGERILVIKEFDNAAFHEPPAVDPATRKQRAR